VPKGQKILREGRVVKALGEGVLGAGVQRRARLFYIDETELKGFLGQRNHPQTCWVLKSLGGGQHDN